MAGKAKVCRFGETLQLPKLVVVVVVMVTHPDRLHRDCRTTVQSLLLFSKVEVGFELSVLNTLCALSAPLCVLSWLQRPTLALTHEMRTCQVWIPN